MAKKRHLLVRGKGRRAACGIISPPRLTTDPAEVTCGGCKRTLHMADAEARTSGPPLGGPEEESTEE